MTHDMHCPPSIYNIWITESAKMDTIFHKKLSKESMYSLIYGPQREKTCFRWFGNNTGSDQPAHPRSLISAFVIRFLENIICKLATGEISTFCSWGDWFCHDEAHILDDVRHYAACNIPI